MAHEQLRHDSPQRRDGIPFDAALRQRVMYGPSPMTAHEEVTVEASHQHLETKIEELHGSLDLPIYEQFDRVSYDALCASEELDINETPDMYKSFLREYQPARIRVIDGHIARRQSSRETIDKLLALYDRTKGATLTFEQTVQRVPGQLVAVANTLGNTEPDVLQEVMRRFNAIVNKEAVTLLKSVKAFGNDIAELRTSQDVFEDAHTKFMRSTEYIARRIADIATSDEDDDEFQPAEAVPVVSRTEDAADEEQKSPVEQQPEKNQVESVGTESADTQQAEQETIDKFDWGSSTDDIVVDPPEFDDFLRKSKGKK